MARKRTRTREGASTEQERTGAGEHLEKCVVGCIQDLVAEDVVNVIFGCIVLVVVRRVWRDCRALKSILMIHVSHTRSTSSERVGIT